MILLPTLRCSFMILTLTITKSILLLYSITTTITKMPTITFTTYITYMYTHTHTYTHIHTHIHTHTHTYIHTHTHTYTHAYTHLHQLPYMHTSNYRLLFRKSCYYLSEEILLKPHSPNQFSLCIKMEWTKDRKCQLKFNLSCLIYEFLV